jgi:hypothetical protein
MNRGGSNRQRPTTNVAYQQQPPPQQQTATPKLLVSDAIALISLRLGAVERIVQSLQNDTFNSSSNNELINSLIERINILEKRTIEPTENEEITNAIQFLHGEINQLKENLTVQLDEPVESNENDEDAEHSE